MEKYIQRDLEKELLKYMGSKEILAIVGPRRSGKTTIIENILKNQKKKKINELSFDNFKTLRLFEEDIDAFIEEHVVGYDLIFIDEVQYSKDSGKKLKYIYDKHWKKIIISGSSAAEISIQSLKYLVGRIFTFNLYPFSFREFIRARESILEKYLDKKEKSKIILERLNKHLEEYLIFGGYPRVVLSESREEKIKVLEGILNTYLLKEIKEILELSDDYKLMNLMKALSLQIGNMINYSELSSLTGFSFVDLKKYLNILEKTFILKQIKPYFTNKRTEIVKVPKVYFFDLGFRNVIIDNFQKERSDMGAIYENFIFNQAAYGGIELKYWNTKSNAEVDFVFEKSGKVFPIEVKSRWNDKKITKSFRSFVEKYNSRQGYFFSLDYLDSSKEGSLNIEFLPFVCFNNMQKP
ncbi:MAG: ATP-binding protein [Nanoarchaeota archaeon]|jgi:predicted AAA+ superfamily ATPase|nr:ATP-binding protein [Nanoarchaeota archaeon]